MNPKIIIRPESPADISAISDVTIAAFATLEISFHTEQFIVAALRAAKTLTVSLVAELEGRVVGDIAFSPVSISDGTGKWYGLGPLSVLPEVQQQGIGKALMAEGLVRLQGLNAGGCCLVGHPDYYRKFGFDNLPGLQRALPKSGLHHAGQGVAASGGRLRSRVRLSALAGRKLCR